MDSFEIIKVQERPEWKTRAANWFHEKWGIPVITYLESMEECLKKEAAVPQWYIAISKDNIIGGLGVIQNDFHNRKDLTPNICAVHVEEAYRCRGIAGQMLKETCEDMKNQGIDTLYLITNHTSFYERYGWEFLCMVQEEGGNESRIYIHKA